MRKSTLTEEQIATNGSTSPGLSISQPREEDRALEKGYNELRPRMAVREARMLEAALLDLDGTLVATPQAIVDVTQRTLHELGLPAADEQAIKDAIGLPLPLALGQLIGKGPVGAAEAVEVYRRLWRAEINPRLPHLLYPGVIEGLAQLKAAGLKLAVVTGKAQDGADSTVDKSGLRRFIEIVLGYTSVANPKPAPDIALKALELLGVPARNAVVVGDSVHDLRMARAAGVRSIAVTYGALPEPALRAEGPTHVARSFEDVVRICRNLARLEPP